MGQVLQAGVGQAPARQAALAAGLPDSTSATTINRVCGSGLKAIMLAAAEIRAGDAEIVVAGGMESMNRAPFLLPKARFGYRLGDGKLVDADLRDGLWCAFEDCHMGTHAERVAIHDGVSREDQDAFALASHQKAIAAIDAGRFAAELAPVTIVDAKGRETVVDVDEGPRRDTSAEALARLKPVFDLPTGEDRGNATIGHGHGRERARDHGRGGGDGRRVRAGRGAATACGRWPASSATPRPRSRRSGCSSPRSRGSGACSTGSSCRSRRST